MSILVAWSIEVVHLKVVRGLVLVQTEVEVALGCHFSVCFCSEATQLLLAQPVLEPLKLDLVLDQLVDLSLNLCNLRVVT